MLKYMRDIRFFREWLCGKEPNLLAKGTPLLEKGYKGVFDSLSEEKQAALVRHLLR